MAYWMKDIKREIRLYLLVDLHRQDIEQEFIKLDLDISPGTSQWSDMPKGPRTNSSPVERSVIARERILDNLNYRLMKIKEHEERMNRALKQLSSHEREIVELLYLRVDLECDEINEQLAVVSLDWEKRSALLRLYDLFYGVDQRAV